MYWLDKLCRYWSDGGWVTLDDKTCDVIVVLTLTINYVLLLSLLFYLITKLPCVCIMHKWFSLNYINKCKKEPSGPNFASQK